MSVDHIFSHRQELRAHMSSAASSSASEGSTLASYTMRMTFPKSNIQINLNNHYSSKVYTSGSPVSGDVTITTRRDVRFDSLQILLIGSTKTRVDGVNSPQEVTHTFLKMAMPIPESSYPVPRVLEAGRTYAVPFNFVVPHYLTINACNHHVHSDRVREQHVLLPPTVGGWEKDDMAPQMARVEYSIKARVFRDPDCGGKRIKVMEAVHPVRALPASVEEPPLGVTKHDKLYAMSKSKTLRKNILSGKVGKVAAKATEPRAVILRPDGHAAAGSLARICVKFEPAASDAPLPKIACVSGKIVAHTFYSSGGMPTFSMDRRGSYSTSTSLHSFVPERVRWDQHVSAAARRDSGYASDSASDSGGEGTGRRASGAGAGLKPRNRAGVPVYYTTTLEFPINLPVEKKAFIPTFHSCIASRIYVLQLSISAASGASSSTIVLSLPLQVAVDSTYQQDMGLPSFETAVEEAEADEHLRPRLMQVPEEQYTETSMLPGYGDLMSTR
jgi:hypothetical protein